MHPICLKCKFGCKKPDNPQTRQMEPTDFCPYFEQYGPEEEHRQKRWLKLK